MSNTDIAMDIATLQANLSCGGLGQQETLVQLNQIKCKALGLMDDQAREEDILKGYRRDAVEQVTRLQELLAGINATTAPTIELVHILACAELVVSQVYRYFYRRNRVAARSLGMLERGKTD